MLRNKHLPREIMWVDFIGTIWSIIKYYLPDTTLSVDDSWILTTALYK